MTLSKFLTPGDVFLDCGAHVGYYSLIGAAMVGESGKIIAFEPNPQNYQQLKEHVELNGFKNILPLQYATGDQLSVVQLFQNATNDGGHTLWRESKFQEVTIDAIVGKLGIKTVKAIKLDVEGSEAISIRGSTETLTARGVELLIIEIHEEALDAMGTPISELLRMLTELGFVGFSMLDAQNYSRITFDDQFNPYGKWWDYHRVCVENVFFIHQTSPTLASLEQIPG